jgi:two-component system chemotaxis response regulator CheB
MDSGNNASQVRTASDLPHVVVIGASFGGVTALLDLLGTLPADFPAIVAVVLHVGAQNSILPELLTHRGPLPAHHARHGEPPVPGTVYVAPPDHHLLLTPEAVRLTRGPRENHARPAVDPLFRSAALGWGPRCIGLVLTGHMDDGTAGLEAIKACGGTAIVQDPSEAMAPGMPASALAHVAVDHCLPVAHMAELLVSLVAKPAPAQPVTPPQNLVREHAFFTGERSMDTLMTVATPSQLTCPECGGALSELKETRPLRYRCHTGHAYTALSLESAQAEQANHALQGSLRSLKEREMLLRRLAMVAQQLGDEAQAQIGRAQAQRVHEQVEQLARLIEEDLRSA